MPEIIPAIIANDFNDLKSKISQLDGLVSWAQIDVMDGAFVSSHSWNNPTDLDDIDVSINLEAHLMIQEPEKSIDAWIQTRLQRIFIHYESTTPEHIENIIDKVKKSGKQVGIALKIQTPLWVIDFLMEKKPFDSIQLMGIDEIGSYGMLFDEKVLERIQMIHDKYPTAHISVDGGITLKNAQKIIHAGADRLVVGSAIFKSDNISEAIHEFTKIIS